jgi:23S rRNA (adenine2030-N6)-methyltransferase
VLSYRHVFHAGNAPDVLKHGILVFCLDYLGQKEKPCLLIDTHAGAGSYTLAKEGAGKQEWEGGIGRLLPLAGRGLPSLLEGYLSLAGFPAYPGSPALMAQGLRPGLRPGRNPGLRSGLCPGLRPGDRLVCFELHPGDYRSLREFLREVPRAEVRQEDGLAGLRGLLPPPSRRALVLIDPSYEVKDDYTALPLRLREALDRFPQGIYLVWYPLLGAYPASGELPEQLMGLYRGNRCRVELYTGLDKKPRQDSPRGMYGSGLVIYNPPWTLRAALESSLPVLGSLLGTGPGAWMLRWENAGPQP